MMGVLDKFVPHMFFDLGLVGDSRVQEEGSSGNRLHQDNRGLEPRRSRREHRRPRHQQVESRSEGRRRGLGEGEWSDEEKRSRKYGKG